MTTLPDAVRRQRARRPAHVAVVDQAGALTYDALGERVGLAAGRLARRLPAGARVGLLAGNAADGVCALYGALAAGLVAVPLDADIHPRTLATIIDDCGVSAILVTPRLEDRATTGAVPTIRITRELFEADEEGSAPLRSPGGRDLACILYTTGTTGARKGVMLTHANLLAATANINAFMRPGPWLVESIPMRLSHSFGFARLRAVFDVGGTAVLEEGLARVDRLLGGIVRHGVNALSMVPGGFGLLLDHYREPFEAIGGRLRLIEIGSAAMPRAHRDRLLDLCPHARICIHYGLTEASRATFLDLRTDRAALDSVGRASPGVEIRVAGPRPGAAASASEPGEVQVKGAMVAAGYWGRPDLTAAALADGWLRTGDLGWLDDRGYLYLAGRREDILNLGGMKVAAAEVEECLREAPGVADAAVALGCDPEAVAPALDAFVVLAAPDRFDGVDGLRAHCAASLEPYKVPRRFLVVDALPRTTSGKLQRHLLDQLIPGRTWTNPITTSDRSSPRN